MQQVVTLTGVEEKGRGNNARGPWALRLFTANGGTKFQTFDVELGDKALSLLNQSVDVEYEIEDNGKYKNNVLKAVKEATGNDGAYDAAKHVAVQQAVNNGSRSDFQRSKEEVRRTEAVKAAAAIISSLAWTGGTEPSDLFELAAQIAVYNEQGAEAFAESVQF